MERIAVARTRLEQATDLPAILGAAHGAFEAMLPVIHAQEDRLGGGFAAFVMAAASAANGRDAIAFAPSLPPTAPVAVEAIGKGQHRPDTEAEAAAALAGLSQVLVSRLADAASWAGLAADRVACSDAARYATEVWSLLAGAPDP
jgi:hypothetical protein